VRQLSICVAVDFEGDAVRLKRRKEDVLQSVASSARGVIIGSTLWLEGCGAGAKGGLSPWVSESD
jgi:hypothetical protein